jgi:hypothetical protein
MRNIFVKTNIRRICEFLKMVQEYPKFSKTELRKQGKYEGGNLNIITDSKIMRLITENGRYRLTELGQKLLNNPKDPETLKIAGLNVPAYREIYEKNPSLKTESEIYALVSERLSDYYSNINTVKVNANLSSKRYLEYVHNIEPSRARRIRFKPKKSTQKDKTNKPYLLIGNRKIIVDRKQAFRIVLDTEMNSNTKAEIIEQLYSLSQASTLT